jgi:hypothetical protein
MFSPAHDAVVMWALEPGSGTSSITESTNGETAATLPAAPTPAGILGYTNLPQGARGLNNSKGFAIGMQGAAYPKRGRREPSVEIAIRPGSLAALQNLVPDENGVLPYICIWVVVKGQYSDCYRYCKPGSLAFAFAGGDGQGGEITITVPFQAIAYQRVAAIAYDPADVRALGTPLFWHDVRTFTIENSAGVTASYRRALMSLNASVDYQLERKNERPNWGDGVALSNTAYHLLEHHTAVSGEMGLHERLPEALFSTLANSQDWGDISIWCSDAPLVLPETKGFTLTLGGCFPTDETRQGAESSAEIDHTVSFTANTITFELDEV